MGSCRRLVSLCAAVAALLAPATAAADGGRRALPLTPTAGTGPARAAVETGVLERVHGHARRDRASVDGRMLRTRDGRRIPLRLTGRIAVPDAGARVRVRGTRRGNVLTVHRLRVLAPAARAAATPAGAKRTAVLLFNFTDDRSEPFTPDEVRERLFTGEWSADAFFRQISHGRMSLTGRDRVDGDVYGWLELDAPSTPCFGTADAWDQEIARLLDEQDLDLTGYDHVVHVHPRTDACGWSGLATVGGGWSDLNGSIGLWLTGHELGHNYGMYHSAAVQCVDAAGERAATGPAANCTVDEYGDPFDIMGDGGARHPNAAQLLQLGFVPRANLRRVSTSGTYAIAPQELETTAPQVLEIPRGDRRFLYLETRTPTGIFDTYALDAPVVNGVTVRIARDARNAGRTELIDTTPETHGPGVEDQPLAAGRTLTDHVSGVSITTLTAGPDGASVAVELPAAPEPERPPYTPPPAPAAPPVVTRPAPVPPAPAAAPDWRAPSAVRLLGARTAASVRTRVSTADGRGVTVRRGLEVRFDRAGLGGLKLQLRAKAPRACSLNVRARRGRGRWSTAAVSSIPRGWRLQELVLSPPSGTGAVTLRLACAGHRSFTADAVRLAG